LENFVKNRCISRTCFFGKPKPLLLFFQPDKINLGCAHKVRTFIKSQVGFQSRERSAHAGLVVSNLQPALRHVEFTPAAWAKAKKQTVAQAVWDFFSFPAELCL
jgi:hypothetical protein